MKKIICKIFGHKYGEWEDRGLKIGGCKYLERDTTCVRCGKDIVSDSSQK